jgi:hypothetical protein
VNTELLSPDKHPLWQKPVWRYGLQGLVIGFWLLLFFLAIRSYIYDDFQFGWQMFRYHARYKIRYSEIYRNGQSVSFSPGKELKGQSRLIDDDRWRGNYYGMGFTRNLIRYYLRYRYEKIPRAAGVKALRATMTYRINQEPRWASKTLTYPEP